MKGAPLLPTWFLLGRDFQKNLSLEEKKEAGLFVGARADDVGKGKKDTGYLYKAFMVARCWGCECVAPQVSTGNRTRATIKALPATPHHSRPYGI